MRLISLSLVFLCLAGCKSTLSPEDEERSNLVGSWDWIYTDSSNSIQTPSAKGYEIKYVLNADQSFQIFQNDTIVQFYLNGSFIPKAYFRTFFARIACTDQNELILYIGDQTVFNVPTQSVLQDARTFVEFKNDTLIWHWNSCDDVKDYFKKRK